MFWIGLLVGVVSCLVLGVVLVMILVYVFPENLSKSILRWVRDREQKRKDQRACVIIRKTWPQLDDDQVEWLLRLDILAVSGSQVRRMAYDRPTAWLDPARPPPRIGECWHEPCTGVSKETLADEIGTDLTEEEWEWTKRIVRSDAPDEVDVISVSEHKWISLW